MVDFVSPRTLALGLTASALLACTVDGVDASRAADREAYLISLSQQGKDPRAALGACAQIVSESLRGECVALLARDLVATGADAWGACRGLQPGEWRDLCSFEAIDGDGEFGDDVAARCVHTGAYQQRCLAHVLSRHSKREWAVLKPGDEDAMVRWLDLKVREYGVGSEGPQLVRELAGRAVADRALTADPARDFDPEDCGALSADLCRSAFRAYVGELSHRPGFGDACRGGGRPKNMRAEGIPAWSPGVVDDVESVVGEFCRRTTGRSL